MASESEDSGDDGAADVSHLTAEPLDLGPPVKVSALIPLDYGDPGFVAPLPHPRPGSGIAAPDADVLNAYAPGDEAGDGSGPADAIGAAAGNPRPLDSVAPQ